MGDNETADTAPPTERIIEYDFLDDETLFVYKIDEDGEMWCETWEFTVAERSDKSEMDFVGVSGAPYPYTGPFPSKE